MQYKPHARFLLLLLFITQYCSGDKIEKSEMGGACKSLGERRGVYRDVVGKPESKRPPGRPRRRWEYS
jgi:hypothetical protein